MRIKPFRLFESLDQTIYDEINKMIDANSFLKGKVKADNTTVFEAGDYILLLGDISHITDAHLDETIPGSKFNKGVDLKKAIISLVQNNKPTEMTKGFGAAETKVTNPQEAEKFKWLGLDSKMNVGIENVHKLDPNSDEFKSLNVYTYKDSRGNEFKIKVKGEDGKATQFLSFIGAKLGEIGGKPVLSVITAFPGQNGASIANRNDFMKQGYYFTTQNKEIIESSIGQIVESKMKKIQTFEQFSYLQESINETTEAKQKVYDFLSSDEVKKITGVTDFVMCNEYDWQDVKDYIVGKGKKSFSENNKDVTEQEFDKYYEEWVDYIEEQRGYESMNQQDLNWD